MLLSTACSAVSRLRRDVKLLSIVLKSRRLSRVRSAFHNKRCGAGCRYPAMKEAASRQSDHLQGTSGGDDKAYSQLAPESGPHQDKNTRSPPGPHDVSG